MKNLFFLFLLGIVSSCVIDDLDNKLVRINKTNSKFYLIVGNKNDLKNHSNEFDFIGDFLGPFSMSPDLVVNTTWEKEIMNGATKKLEVFLIDAEVAETFSRKELLKSKSNFKHFSFSIKELNSSNWKIVIDSLGQGDYFVRLVKESDTVGVKYKEYIDRPPER